MKRCARTGSRQTSRVQGCDASATLTVDGSSIPGAPLCGVQFAADASVDLANGEVSGAAIGACVQVENYDFGRLTTGVLYRNNGTNLDSPSLPVPAASGSGQF